jgi:hypothetical protein
MPLLVLPLSQWATAAHMYLVQMRFLPILYSCNLLNYDQEHRFHNNDSNTNAHNFDLPVNYHSRHAGFNSDYDHQHAIYNDSNADSSIDFTLKHAEFNCYYDHRRSLHNSTNFINVDFVINYQNKHAKFNGDYDCHYVDIHGAR